MRMRDPLDKKKQSTDIDDAIHIHAPFITENDGSVVVSMSDDPTHSLVHSTRSLLLVPLFPTQALQEQSRVMRCSSHS